MNNKITIAVSAFTKTPNKNGIIYSKETIENAVKKFNEIPIIDRTCSNFTSGIENYVIPNISTIGVITKANFKQKEDIIEFEGKLWNIETSYVKTLDEQNIIFTDVSIVPCNEKGE